MRYGLSAAERERVKLCIDEGKQRVADQRSRLAKLERLGGDTALSKRLLVTFEASLRLMISYGYTIERTPTGMGPGGAPCGPSFSVCPTIGNAGHRAETYGRG